MKVGIVSDIHDHIDNLRQALSQLQEVETLICCGDLCSPFIIDEFGKGFAGGEIHIVFGNNDGDLFRIATRAAAYPHIKLHGEFCELELDGTRFAVNHFDNIGRALAKYDAYDVVCFGHNHQFEVAKVAGTLIINPGEIMGGLTGTASFVSYDTTTGSAEQQVL